MIITPVELIPYIDFEEGKVVSNDLPPELENEFQKFKRTYETAKQDKYTDF